jgi:hypothetical protein
MCGKVVEYVWNVYIYIYINGVCGECGICIYRYICTLRNMCGRRVDYVWDMFQARTLHPHVYHALTIASMVVAI